MSGVGGYVVMRRDWIKLGMIPGVPIEITVGIRENTNQMSESAHA